MHGGRNASTFCHTVVASECTTWYGKNDVAKNGGTTENMEVDTPASDKKERQNRDGGPSET